MQVKRGYKPTEVGVIPEDWDVVHLGDIGKFKNGINKGSEAFGHGSPFVNLMDVFGVSKIASTEALGLVETNEVEQKSYNLKKGDVVFIRSSVKPSGVGLTATVENDLPKTVYSGFLIRFRDGDALDIHFKRHCFYEEGFRKRVISASSVSANTNINQDNLKQLLLPFPPTKAEQKAIAEALSDADALIESLEQLIAKKRQIKQGVMQELLTGKTRLHGFNEEWREKTLGDLGTTYGGLSGKTKADFGVGSARYITFMNVMTNVVIDRGGYARVTVSPTEKQNRARKGDLFFNGSSEVPEEVGMCAVLLEDVEHVYLNSFCFGFRLRDRAEADGTFLAYHIRSTLGRELMQSLAQGSTRYNLSKSALLTAPLRLPKADEQRAIAKILRDIDAGILALEVKLRKAQQVKQGMMQELLTGRIRLV